MTFDELKDITAEGLARVEAATTLEELRAAEHDVLGRRSAVASLNQQSQLRDIPGTVLQDNLPQIAVQTLQFNYKINTEANPDVGSGRLDGGGIPADFFADVHVRRGFAYAFDY